MDVVTMDKIMVTDILNDDVYNDLWELSTFKYENGFDFIVKKNYIETYISDFEDDNKKLNRPFDDTYYYLKNIILSMKSDFLFIKHK